MNVILAIIVLGLWCTLVPITAIWALNTLFALGLEYSAMNIWAMFILLCILNPPKYTMDK